MRVRVCGKAGVGDENVHPYVKTRRGQVKRGQFRARVDNGGGLTESSTTNLCGQEVVMLGV